jgi:hypothetical protein
MARDAEAGVAAPLGEVATHLDRGCARPYMRGGIGVDSPRLSLYPAEPL